MAGVLEALPACPRGLDRGLVVAVEQVEAAHEAIEIAGLDAVDKDQKRGAVGIFFRRRQVDRLRLGVAVARRAVGQERRRVEGP